MFKLWEFILIHKKMDGYLYYIYLSNIYFMCTKKQYLSVTSYHQCWRSIVSLLNFTKHFILTARFYLTIWNKLISMEQRKKIQIVSFNLFCLRQLIFNQYKCQISPLKIKQKNGTIDWTFGNFVWYIFEIKEKFITV